MFVPPSATATSGAVIVPVTVKLNGFSFESLLVNWIVPANVPALPVARDTVNVSDPLAGMEADRPSVIE